MLTHCVLAILYGIKLLSSLVQVIYWDLFDTKPLPEPMVTYCQLNLWGVNFSEFWLKKIQNCLTKLSWKMLSAKYRPCSGLNAWTLCSYPLDYGIMMAYISMVKCKTAVSPLLTHWRYCSLALNHGYYSRYSRFWWDVCTYICGFGKKKQKKTTTLQLRV